MKIQPLPAILCLWLATLPGFAQGFVNLGFESANVSPLPPGQAEYVSTANAFPGWQVYWGSQLAGDAGHNWTSIGAVMASIQGPNYPYSGIIEGSYPAVINGGFLGGVGLTSASLAQVGMVPALTESLRFKVFPGSESTLSVYLGGQSLSLVPLEFTAGYTLYGADIHGFAGQLQELRFTADYVGLGIRQVYLDAIQFSTSPVPEPSTWALLALGAGSFWWLARSRRPRA